MKLVLKNKLLFFLLFIFLMFLLFFSFLDFLIANKIPNDLLDIKMELVGGPVYKNISQLSGALYLENFGLTPTNVTFSYFIFNSSNDILWSFKTNYKVFTSLQFFSIPGLNISDIVFLNGNYYLYIESNYGEDFIDFYRYDFEIDSDFKEEFLPKDYFWFLSFVILTFIITFIYFFKKFFRFRY